MLNQVCDHRMETSGTDPEPIGEIITMTPGLTLLVVTTTRRSRAIKIALERKPYQPACLENCKWSILHSKFLPILMNLRRLQAGMFLKLCMSAACMKSSHAKPLFSESQDQNSLAEKTLKSSALKLYWEKSWSTSAVSSSPLLPVLGALNER